MGERVSPKTLFNIPTTQLNAADFLFHPLLKVVKVRKRKVSRHVIKFPSKFPKIL